MILTGETHSVRRTTTHLTWTELGLHPCLCSERLGITASEIKLSNIQGLSPYRRVNTMLLVYKKETLNTAYKENPLFLQRNIRL